MSSADKREFDLVIWGATGFTGCLVARYLAEHSQAPDLDWAIAGRNHEKLATLRDELGPNFKELPILIGDCFDRDSLDAIAARTRVICTTVGPYAEYGHALVAACVEAGTDYCDLTGEAHFIRRMMDIHHDEAKAKDVRIVHCCGFDSIPSDLGTYLLQQEAIKQHGAPCREVKLLVWKIRGSVSGGTIASVATSMEAAMKDREIGRIMGNPYALNPEGRRQGPDGSFQQGPKRDEKTGNWTGPFLMAVINEKIVRRTNALLENQYGEDFRYSEASHVGSGLPGAFRATFMAAGFGAFGAAMAVKPTRTLLRRFVLPSPGEGPDKEAREAGYFSVRLFGSGVDNDDKAFELVATVSADSDPGYGATAVMLGESALCLAKDDTPNGLQGGILTPASAMGDVLIQRLREAGMTLEIE